MEKALEIDFISKIAQKFKRSPLQRNKIHQTDAEIIDLNNGFGKYLAVTTDTISEEIKFGLYDDPFLIGWMTVMVNMSDLAAVGAAPLGILISESFTSGMDEECISKIQEGIEAACRTCNTFVLGGDISSTEQLSLTGCAIGILERKKFLSRVGCQAGDFVYSTGKLGQGNGFALQKFNQLKTSSINYKPCARLTEGKDLIATANCCMDTSDGVISTLDLIMRLNKCGIRLDDNWEHILDEESANVCKQLNIPLWFLLAGYQGEFELIFSISPNSEERLLGNCRKNNWTPIKIGQAIVEQDLILNLYGKERKIDSSFIRNLAFKHSNNIKSYITSLFEYDGVLRTN
jgi:thiamine-monophosphate kinase